MKTVKKNVYYCEYCKKKNLSASSMSVHEKHCTGNPNRDCRMCNGKHNIGEIVEEYKKRFTLTEIIPNTVAEIGHTDTHLVTWIGKEVKLEEIRNRVDGCPNCMLAIIRQCKFGHHYFKDFGEFKYQEEVATKRREEYNEPEMF